MEDQRLAFSKGEYEERVAAVRRIMAERRIDALIVTSPENICYLSGYHTTGYHVFQCLILPAGGEPRFVVRNIEVGNVHRPSWVAEADGVFIGDDPFGVVAEALVSLVGRRGRVGYEDQGFFLTPAGLDGLRHHLPEAELIAASGVVETPRAIKSPAEIAKIRRAAAAACAGLLAGADAGRPGATENDVAAAVYGGMVKAGSEYTGSPPYVAAGARSATSHATYAMNVVGERDTLWIELAGSIDRYHGAVGRVVAVGRPSADVARLYAIACGAADAMIDAIGPDAAAGDVDRAGRQVVEDAGLGDCWNNRGAYALGISFPPGLGEGHIMDIKPGDQRRLHPGMAFHLIPILKVPGTGAMGCTETVVVTEDGCESLNTVPRALVLR